MDVLVIQKTLEHDDLSRSLLSISQLCQLPGVKAVNFTALEGVVFNTDGNALLRAPNVNGLYLLKQSLFESGLQAPAKTSHPEALAITRAQALREAEMRSRKKEIEDLQERKEPTSDSNRRADSQKDTAPQEPIEKTPSHKNWSRRKTLTHKNQRRMARH